MATLHSRPILHSYDSVRAHMMYGSSVILCYSLVLVTGITNIAIATVGQAAHQCSFLSREISAMTGMLSRILAAAFFWLEVGEDIQGQSSVPPLEEEANIK